MVPRNSMAACRVVPDAVRYTVCLWNPSAHKGFTSAAVYGVAVPVAATLSCIHIFCFLSSCEVENFAETHLCKLRDDTSIALNLRVLYALVQDVHPVYEENKI